MHTPPGPLHYFAIYFGVLDQLKVLEPPMSEPLPPRPGPAAVATALTLLPSIITTKDNMGLIPVISEGVKPATDVDTIVGDSIPVLSKVVSPDSSAAATDPTLPPSIVATLSSQRA